MKYFFCELIFTVKFCFFSSFVFSSSIVSLKSYTVCHRKDAYTKCKLRINGNTLIIQVYYFPIVSRNSHVVWHSTNYRKNRQLF